MFTSIIIEILKTCFCNDDRPAFVDKKGVLFSEFGDVIYFFDSNLHLENFFGFLTDTCLLIPSWRFIFFKRLYENIYTVVYMHTPLVHHGIWSQFSSLTVPISGVSPEKAGGVV